MRRLVPFRLLLLLLPAAGLSAGAAERLRLATYNVENYVLEKTESRDAKPEASRAQVARMLSVCEADVIALQEVGGEAALGELRARLARLGRDYPHWEWVRGRDTNIQVAVISRFPITRRRPHVVDTYLLSGRRFHVSRGILEVDVTTPGGYVLTMFTAHLKSRRAVPEADEAEMRAAEARILRAKVDARLRENPRANVVVLGDLNDTRDSVPLRTLLGRGRAALVDTRPGERNGDTGHTPNPRWEPRTVTWTHYYGKEDSYGRIDYVLLHTNAAREWVRGESWIVAEPDWGLASDHRPVLVTLEAVEK